jgi:hypothetical protein
MNPPMKRKCQFYLCLYSLLNVTGPMFGYRGQWPPKNTCLEFQDYISISSDPALLMLSPDFFSKHRHTPSTLDHNTFLSNLLLINIYMDVRHTHDFNFTRISFQNNSPHKINNTPLFVLCMRYMKQTRITLIDEISGSHGGRYEDDLLLGCCTVCTDVSEVFPASIRAITLITETIRKLLLG